MITFSNTFFLEVILQTTGGKEKAQWAEETPTQSNHPLHSHSTQPNSRVPSTQGVLMINSILGKTIRQGLWRGWRKILVPFVELALWINAPNWLKSSVHTGHQWLIPVILAIQEAEIRRITVWSQPWANRPQDSIENT
jgi:hypothetical protein